MTVELSDSTGAINAQLYGQDIDQILSFSAVEIKEQELNVISLLLTSILSIYFFTHIIF